MIALASLSSPERKTLSLKPEMKSYVTDVTGFSMLGHSLEMAQGSDTQIKIFTDKIDVIEQAYELSQMGLLPEGMYRNRTFAESFVDAGDVPLYIQDILYDPQTSGGLLICVNHLSNNDPVIVAGGVPRQLRFMSKKELFKVPVVGAFLKAIGCYPVDRKGSDIAALRNTINLLKDNDCVGIFPQGTRMPGSDPSTAKVKSGVGLIAARSGADVLPVCIKSKSGKTSMFKKNYLIVGKLIKSEELDIENNKGSEGHQRIADRIYDDI